MSEGFLPALLITFREVLEATLIVATVVTLLTKLKQKRSLRAVWLGTGVAVLLSMMFLVGASLMGLRAQELYSGKTEELVEGVLMVVSAGFVTWAVFWLHTHFAQQKVKLLHKIKKTVEAEEQRGLFILTFTAVLREGIEIVLFLSTIYLSSRPSEILGGFVVGMMGALLVCAGLFTLTLRFPVYWTFRITSWLLVAFAAGLLARGVHEFSELGWLPETRAITLAFLPAAKTFGGEMVKALFGLRRVMDMAQIAIYGGYVGVMAKVLLQREGGVEISRKR